MLYAVSVGMLGYTRIQSVVVYNSKTRAFDELTPAIARNYIKSGMVKGVVWQNNEDGGMFLPDKDFNQNEILVKTAAGKFRPLLHEEPGMPVNSIYTVVRVLYTDYRGTLFEVVSNRYDRIKISEEQLRVINAISPVAGVWISEDKIEVDESIPIEDRRGFEFTCQDCKPVTVRNTMDNVFSGVADVTDVTDKTEITEATEKTEVTESTTSEAVGDENSTSEEKTETSEDENSTSEVNSSTSETSETTESKEATSESTNTVTEDSNSLTMEAIFGSDENDEFMKVPGEKPKAKSKRSSKRK